MQQNYLQLDYPAINLDYPSAVRSHVWLTLPQHEFYLSLPYRKRSLIINSALRLYLARCDSFSKGGSRDSLIEPVEVK